MKNSPIEWTDHTLNFWWGCSKVSPACTHCYAETVAKLFGKRLFGQVPEWGAGKPRFERLAAARKEALALQQRAQSIRVIRGIPMIRSGSVQNVGEPVHGVFVGDFRIPLKKRETIVIPIAEWENATPYRQRVFVNSMSDWLDDEVPIEWLAFLLETIYLCPGLDFQLLTKRPENWGNRISDAMVYLDKEIPTAPSVEVALENPEKYTRTPTALWVAGWIEAIQPQRGLADIPPNIWIGTTVESQEWADKRIPHLLKIPAKVRFLSCEPLLGPIESLHPGDCGGWLQGVEWITQGQYRLYDAGIHWVICGGESGGSARPAHPNWFRSLRDQCAAAGVPFFFKQWGEWLPVDHLKEANQAAGKEQKTYKGQKLEDGTLMLRTGTDLAGAALDGHPCQSFPQ